MKTITRAVILTSILAAPVFAANSNPATEGAGVCKMTSDQQAAMHQHMGAMQELMKNIKAETDPDKREAMMQKHLEEMESGMQTMGGKSAGQCNNMSSLNMDERMGMMEQRMGMMQMMMMQMSEQGVEQMKQQRHKHKH